MLDVYASLVTQMSAIYVMFTKPWITDLPEVHDFRDDCEVFDYCDVF